mmetsp:Transcript_9548/g.14226  ORF Transcript_9548/g.14226 Transcript_9548/m.14226 type:complete len:121 (+) Transcript_9548:1383-1745(+)
MFQDWNLLFAIAHLDLEKGAEQRSKNKPFCDHASQQQQASKITIMKALIMFLMLHRTHHHSSSTFNLLAEHLHSIINLVQQLKINHEQEANYHRFVALILSRWLLTYQCQIHGEESCGKH